MVNTTIPSLSPVDLAAASPLGTFWSSSP